jgi:plasmid stabilization system protein ParE
MKSTYNIVWSDEAVLGLSEIIGYIESRFSEKDVKKFVKILDDHLEAIKNNPKIFPVTSKSRYIRRASVAKLTSIFYKVDGENIYLVSISDNRKNPERLRF